MFNFGSLSRDELIKEIEELGFSLDDVEGSGSNGYVTVGDLEKFLQLQASDDEEIEEESEPELGRNDVDRFENGVEEEVEEEEVDPESIEVPLREHGLTAKEAFIITPEIAEAMIIDSSTRKSKAYERVLYEGQSRKHSLVLNYALNSLREEGILFVPEELSEYSVLDRAVEVSPDENIGGFVAFSL